MFCEYMGAMAVQNSPKEIEPEGEGVEEWREMRLNKEPIGRPRQIYTGENLRPFKSIEKR